MKISIVGSSGSVGRELVRLFFYNQIPFDVELNLFYNSQQGRMRIWGMLSDALIENKDRNVSITNQPQELKGSAIVVLCGGQAITTEIEKIHPSNIANENNRDSVYIENKGIIEYWAMHISNLAPDALVILVTNPVSKLLNDVLNQYPKMKIVGCGITNDTLRVRNEVKKQFPKIDTRNLFVIGEHNLINQTVTLAYYNYTGSLLLEEKLFEKRFETSQEKRKYINHLKNTQNSLLAGNEDFCIDSNIPILYRSYLRHRMAHFLYKTHISTAAAVKEIIMAYVLEDRLVSVETRVNKWRQYENCILGIPVRFVKKEIVVQDIIISSEEEKILNLCAEKYGGTYDHSMSITRRCDHNY